MRRKLWPRIVTACLPVCACEPSNPPADRGISGLDSAQLPPGVTYQLIRVERPAAGWCDLQVRLGRTTTTDELRKLAVAQREKAPVCNKLRIYYYPATGVVDHFNQYGYAFFTPNLELRIQGLEPKAQAAAKRSVGTSMAGVVGAWIYELGVPQVVVIRERQGRFFLERHFPEGAPAVEALRRSRSGDRWKFVLESPPNDFGEHFYLSPSGVLEVWDREGFISSLRTTTLAASR
jgi:hypothetical protein